MEEGIVVTEKEEEEVITGSASLHPPSCVLFFMSSSFSPASGSLSHVLTSRTWHPPLFSRRRRREADPWIDEWRVFNQELLVK